MRTAKQLLEDLDEVRDELDAIVNVATKDERELSDEEQSRVNEITEKVIPRLNTAIENRNKIDAEIKASAAARLTAQIDDRQAREESAERNDAPGAVNLETLKIPAKAKARRPLKAFKGQDADKEAYVAGRFMLANFYNHESSQDFCRQHGLGPVNTMSGGISGGAGGFLIPDEMERTLIRLREERGVFPRYARNIPMGSDNITIPRLITDVTAYWVGETSEITASDASLGAAELVAKKLACLTKVSSELDEDAVVEVGDLVTQSMAYAMADKVDEAGFNGDGTSTYGGFTGLKTSLHANATKTSDTGDSTFATLDLDDFEDAVGALGMYPGMSPRWFIHSTTYWATMGRLQDAAGGNRSDNLADGPSQMFLGYPVTFCQVLPSATAVSTIYAYFGDLSMCATYGTRRGVRVALTDDRYFENDLIGIKTTQRMAINVHERGDTIRTRPMIALKTAAS